MHHETPSTDSAPVTTGAAAHRINWKEALFDAGDDALAVCDRAGVLIEMNARASRMLGLPDGAASASRTLEGFLTASAWKRLGKVLRREEGAEEILAGVTLVVKGRLSMLVDVQSTPLSGGFLLLTLRDAGRRWRMESHAHRLVSAIDSSRDVVYLTDAQGRITFVNAAFQGMTGHAIEEVLGQTPSLVRAPAQEKISEECASVVAGGKDWIGEFVNQRKDGTTYPVETVVSPIFGKNGDFLGGAAFERDLTAKRELQKQLLIERDFVRSILNSLEAAVYTLDRSFCLTDFNDGWKRLPVGHGWLCLASKPLEIGQPLLSYVQDPERRAELQTVFDFVLKKSCAEEIHAASADKSQHWAMKISPLWQEGEVRGLIYAVTDQTYLHQLQSQLNQAQKMETVGALAAGVAHDFNNLLLVIRGSLSLLQMNPKLPAELQPRLESIDKASNRAADVTQQLLSFSHASEEKETVLDFNAVVRDACGLAKRSLIGKVRLKFDLHHEVLKVKIDNTRAQQALLNLCVNARDAMPNGGELEIKTRAIELKPAQAQKAKCRPGSPFVLCSVRDTGTGIPQELMARIFDPFFTTKEKGKGTGLGLAIVHNVVAKGGGFLEVESVVNQGTTFHLYFPVASELLTAQAKKEERPLLRGSGRVLVVDDLDLVREYAETFLTEAGYQVVTAGSAEEALATLFERQGAFDLVLTDYNMSGKSGWQLIRESSQQWPAIKFILASGYLEDDERGRIENEGKIRILNKPFKMQDAVELVAELLGQYSRSEAA